VVCWQVLEIQQNVQQRRFVMPDFLTRRRGTCHFIRRVPTEFTPCNSRGRAQQRGLLTPCRPRKIEQKVSSVVFQFPVNEMADGSGPLRSFFTSERLWVAISAIAIAGTSGFGLKTFLDTEHISLADRQRDGAKEDLSKAKDELDKSKEVLKAANERVASLDGENKSLSTQLASTKKELAELKAKPILSPPPPPKRTPTAQERFAEIVSAIDKTGLSINEAIPVLEGRYSIQGGIVRSEGLDVCIVSVLDADDQTKRSSTPIKQGTRADILLGNRVIRIFFRGVGGSGCSVDATIVK
jgi:hypothetical protein